MNIFIKLIFDSYLETSKTTITVSGIDVVEINARSLDFRVRTEHQFEQTLELQDVHFATQVLGQMTVNPKGHLAVLALEGSRIAGCGCAKC